MQVLPAIGSIYNIPATKLTLAEAFIVRYCGADGQNELPLHTDGSLYSFNLLLSEATDFEGGEALTHSHSIFD